VVQLHQHKDEFENRQAQVVVIGFEKERRARGWRDQTGVTFPFLLDPERQVYQDYQIERSFWRSWSPRNLWSYVKAFFQGREIPNIGEDPNQMGADFIVDKGGILRMTYYSEDPTDRPSVERILSTLDEIG
jgi:peroxiredoxin